MSVYSCYLHINMQMGDAGCYCEENYRLALNDIKNTSPETKLILSVGDQTNNSSVEAYETLKSIKNDVLPDVPVYYAIGNHDRGYTTGYGESAMDISEWKARFLQYAKDSSKNEQINDVYYSFMLEGSYVIFLGSEVSSRRDSCNDVFISETQYNWFIEKMEEANKTDKPIFVVIHEPFSNTVSGSLPGQGWQGNAKDPDYYEGNKYEALKAVTDKYPHALVFSGHTHWELSSKQPALISNGISGANYFNCASVGYLWYDTNTGARDEAGMYTGSEGWYVYVYSDRVELKGRNFITGAWIIEKTVYLNDGNITLLGIRVPLLLIVALVVLAVAAVFITVFAVISVRKKKYL